MKKAVILDVFYPYEVIVDDLEALGLEVSYHYNHLDEGGLDKDMWLKEIANWDNMFYLHYTHGLRDRFLIGADGYIRDKEVREAMKDRPAYRLAILHSCNSANPEGTLPDAFTRNGQKKSAVIGYPDTTACLSPWRIEYLLKYIREHPGDTLFTAFQSMQEQESLETWGIEPNHSVFVGDKEMLCGEVFNPLWGNANQDGSINVLDMTKIARIILGLDAPVYEADVNQDGQINVLDMTKLAQIIVGGA